MPRSAAALRADLLAGLTVTLVGIPQCLAYALIAGLPPAYGLSTAAIPGLVAALAGRSHQIITGPTNTTALLILVALTPYLGPNGLLPQESLAILATLALMAGLIRIALAWVGGAELIRFLPESVLAGFTAGAGVLIGTMQLDEAIGFGPVRGASLWAEFKGLNEALAAGETVMWPALTVTVVSIAAIAAGQRYRPRWPLPLMVVTGAVAWAWLAGLDSSTGLPLARDRSALPVGWPPGALPSLDPALWLELLAPAAAIVLLGTLELTVCARAHGAHPDMRRELQAQGWANVAGAFSAAFPASASLTRSALVRLGGAKSRFAAAAAAIVILPILLFGGTFISAIPQSALAGVLLITAYGMVDKDRLHRMWRGAKETRFLLVVTFLATLILPLQWAILLGTGLGIGIHLAQTSKPRLERTALRGNQLVPLPPEESAGEIVIEISGYLHFAAIAPFMEEVSQLLDGKERRVVIDLSHAHALRFAALTALESLAETLESRDARLGLAGVAPAFIAQLRSTGSPLHSTAYDPRPTGSAIRCMEELREAMGELGAEETPQSQSTNEG